VREPPIEWANRSIGSGGAADWRLRTASAVARLAPAHRPRHMHAGTAPTADRHGQDHGLAGSGCRRSRATVHASRRYPRCPVRWRFVEDQPCALKLRWRSSDTQPTPGPVMLWSAHALRPARRGSSCGEKRVDRGGSSPSRAPWLRIGFVECPVRAQDAVEKKTLEASSEVVTVALGRGRGRHASFMLDHSELHLNASLRV